MSPYFRTSVGHLESIIHKAMDEALETCDALDELIERLHNGIVHFRYKKNSGEIREAFGTLKPCFFECSSAAPRVAYNKSTCVYFDLEKQDWRCFCVENFIDIIGG